MKLEIFGSLFAVLLSLFVAVGSNSLTFFPQAHIGSYTRREDEQESLASIYRNFVAEGEPRSPRFAGEAGLEWGISKRKSEGIAQNPPSINAQSVWVGCLCEEVPLLAEASRNQLPLASVTKIMTSYLALRELGPDYLVTISDEAVATEGIAGDLQAGEWLTVKDLITMAMTFSSNDAAMALAEALGRAHGSPTFSDAIQRTVWLMNDEAKFLDMNHTFFQNPTGLDLPRVESRGLPAGPSNFSTTEDWTMLLEATAAQPLLWDLSRDPAPSVVSKNGIAHELFNLNPFRSFPYYVGGKTGTTDSAGENLVMLFEKPLGKLHALILFGVPPGARETEAQKLLDWMNRA